MANAQRPQGARPKGDQARCNRYVAGGTIYPGDFVLLNSSGQVVVGTATAALCGVAASYAVSGDDILVWDDPAQLFIVQSDDATEPAAQTAINLNYNIIATSPSSTYKMSRQQLDGSTGNTTIDLPLKLMGIDYSANNTIGPYALCIVKINNHQFSAGTGTLGV